jgi:hypothetical protein
MFDEQIYRQALESAQAWAVRQNDFNRASRLELCARWMVNADIARAKNEPQPPQPPKPAPVISVVGVPGSTDQSTITVILGPELVADAADLALPPIKGFMLADFPAGVCAPGHDYGDTMAALPQDTMADGAEISHNGKRWRKVEGVWPFGRKSLYVRVV